MRKKLFITLPLLAVLFSFAAFDDVLETLLQKIDKYNFDNPQEKAYLHTDRAYYTAGETLWFKAFLVEGMTNHPDTVSIPLYVDLIDVAKGRVIDSKTIQLTKGFGNGEFKFADTLARGAYRIRAYTNWMKNFPEDQFFHKDFYVFEFEEKEVRKTEKMPEHDFNFFPEGGQLVSGLQSRIGFKASDKLGRGVNVTGAVFNSVGDTVIKFESQHLGMGLFNFTPEKGQKYTARVSFNAVEEKDIVFPDIAEKGYILMTDNFSNPKNLKTFVFRNTLTEPEDMILVAQCRGKVVYSARVQLTKPASAILIPKEGLPSGLIKLTLLTIQSRPVCERLLYNNLSQSPNVTFNLTQNTYVKRSKTTVEIQVSGPSGEPLAGEFSVAVLDKNQIKDHDDERHIRSYLMLESEVKGYVENPAAYFVAGDPKASVLLDLLLMTQGWRRYSWEQVFNYEEKPYQYLLERGLTIAGEITKPNGKNYEKPVNLTLMITKPDSSAQMYFTEAALDGRFEFYGLDVKDSVKILLQAIAGKNNRNTAIIIANNDFKQIDLVRIPYRPVSFAAHDLAAYLKLSKEILELERKLRLNKVIFLDEFVVKAKKVDQRLKDRRMLYGSPDASIKVTDNMTGYSNVLEILRGRVAGVQVSGDMFNPSVVIRGIGTLSGSSEPTYVLDGTIVDKSLILSIPATDVEYIDVLKGPSAAIYGSRGGNGVIAVLTKRGNPDYDWKNDDTPGIKRFGWKGYSEPAEFYVPPYDQEIPGNERPDFRSTVYWNPVVRTDATGKGKFEYFNTDNEAIFEIYLEGLAFPGTPVTGRKTYQVK
jgi:TonB-dependent SusC/RagA subfamily outer membrane receptor